MIKSDWGWFDYGKFGEEECVRNPETALQRITFGPPTLYGIWEWPILPNLVNFGTEKEQPYGLKVRLQYG